MALEEITSRLDLLAEILGICPRRIQQLVEEEVIPRPEKQGAYDIPACVQAYYYKEYASDKDKNIDGYMERARKAKAEADRIEFELDVKKNKYVQADLVEYELEKIIMNCRARLLALPRKLAPLLAMAQNPSEVEETLTNGVNEALNELVKPGFDEAITGNTENKGGD